LLKVMRTPILGVGDTAGNQCRAGRHRETRTGDNHDGGDCKPVRHSKFPWRKATNFSIRALIDPA
jgi:hypothetical protein